MGSHADRITVIRRLYGNNPDVAWLTREVEQCRDWLRWLLDVKGETCRYDHNGVCQEHNLDEAPCPVEQIVAYFAAGAIGVADSNRTVAGTNNGGSAS